MKPVFVLWHVDEDEDEKLIGVYQSEELAQAAIVRLKEKPGFSQLPSGFMYDRYELNRDHWEEGFVRVSSQKEKRDGD